MSATAEIERVVTTVECPVTVTREEVVRQVVSVGSQGPRGATGGIDTLTPADIGALAISARLSEFDTPTAKAEARANLELQNIDAGTFN